MMIALRKFYLLIILVTINIIVIGVHAQTQTQIDYKVFPSQSAPGKIIRISGSGFSANAGCAIKFEPVSSTLNQNVFISRVDIENPKTNGPIAKNQIDIKTDENGNIWELIRIEEKKVVTNTIEYTSAGKYQIKIVGYNINPIDFEVKQKGTDIISFAKMLEKNYVESNFTYFDFTLNDYTPVPIQSSENSNLDNDVNFEVVQGKPFVILVKRDSNPPISWTVKFNGNPVTVPPKFSSDNKLLFLGPILPTDASTDQTIEYSDDKFHSTTTKIDVLPLPNFCVGDSYLARLDPKKGTPIDYGTMELANYYYMSSHINNFIMSTYPINTYTTDWKYMQPGSLRGSHKDPLAGILVDAQNIANLAVGDGGGGNSAGIAYGPNNAPMDYFTYHGFPSVAGISFGPSLKGGVALEGYWSAGAHEVGHMFGLYNDYEEYHSHYGGPPGITCVGVNPKGGVTQDGTVIKGVDFMGLGNEKDLTSSWVCSSTFVQLFKNLKAPGTDPDIFIARGILYKNGTVSSLSCYATQGTPSSEVPTGHYALQCFDKYGTFLNETRFDLQFKAYIEPTKDVPADTPGFGVVDTDFAGFCFAAYYPPGTWLIKFVDLNNPSITANFTMDPPFPRVEIGGPYSARVGETVNLNATILSGVNLLFRWDYDNNGLNDTAWAPSPLVSYKWTEEWSGNARLEFTDGFLTQSSVTPVTITHPDTPLYNLMVMLSEHALLLIGLITTLIAVFVAIWRTYVATP